MIFDDELESLEVEAYQKLEAIPKGELRRLESQRSPSSEVVSNETADAVNAVIDFKENHRAIALTWAADFATRFVSEIRTQVCSGASPELGETAGITPKTAASAIAAWVVASFGVTSPIAFAAATLVVLVLARALRTAFCAMTEDEVRAAIKANP